MRIDMKKRVKPQATAADPQPDTVEAALNQLKGELDKRNIKYDATGPNELTVHFEDGTQRIGAWINKDGIAQYQELFGEAGMDLEHTLDWIGSGRKML